MLGVEYVNYPECICLNRGTGQICSGGNDSARHRQLMTGDRLYDLTGVNLTKYIVTTAGLFDSRCLEKFKYSYLFSYINLFIYQCVTRQRFDAKTKKKKVVGNKYLEGKYLSFVLLYSLQTDVLDMAG